MKNELYYITNEIAVLESSITDLDIATLDADANGYLKSDGTNRRLKHGVAPNGQHYIYMTTNASDVPMYDDLDDARNWCMDMGNVEDDDNERIETGARRLRLAVEQLRARYAGNEDVLEMIDWYANKAAEVEASIEVEDED